MTRIFLIKVLGCAQTAVLFTISLNIKRGDWMEEKDIIGLLMNRKEEAIEELGAKYGKLCGQLAFRVLNNEQDVQECVNDTYFAVWENIPPDCPSHLTAYVCKIAVSLSTVSNTIPAKNAVPRWMHYCAN